EQTRAPEPPTKKRNIFAGLKLRAPRARQLDLFDERELKAGPLPSRKHSAASVERSFAAQVEEAARSHARERSRLSAAGLRHARIVRDVRAAHSAGQAYTSEQRAEVAASRSALDALRAEGRTDLERAFAGDLKLIDQAAAGHTDQAIKAMEAETRRRTGPKAR